MSSLDTAILPFSGREACRRWTAELYEECFRRGALRSASCEFQAGFGSEVDWITSSNGFRCWESHCPSGPSARVPKTPLELLLQLASIHSNMKSGSVNSAL